MWAICLKIYVYNIVACIYSVFTIQLSITAGWAVVCHCAWNSENESSHGWICSSIYSYTAFPPGTRVSSYYLQARQSTRNLPCPESPIPISCQTIIASSTANPVCGCVMVLEIIPHACRFPVHAPRNQQYLHVHVGIIARLLVCHCQCIMHVVSHKHCICTHDQSWPHTRHGALQMSSTVKIHQTATARTHNTHGFNNTRHTSMLHVSYLAVGTLESCEVCERGMLLDRFLLPWSLP